MAETIGSAVIASGEIEQFLLGIRKPAFSGYAANPMRQFTVVFPGIC